MPQRSVRFPDELHAALTAEAERRGKPHTFSSVLSEVATRGLEILHTEANGSPSIDAPATVRTGATPTRTPAAVAARRDIGPKRAVAPILKKGKR